MSRLLKNLPDGWSVETEHESQWVIHDEDGLFVAASPDFEQIVQSLKVEIRLRTEFATLMMAHNHLMKNVAES
jgi:hypothetical protein